MRYAMEQNGRIPEGGYMGMGASSVEMTGGTQILCGMTGGEGGNRTEIPVYGRVPNC